MTLTDGPMIPCRAQVSQECQNERVPVAEVYEDGIADDATWNGKTVVCDACYQLVDPFMVMNEDDIPRAADTATNHYKTNVDFAQRHEDPRVLLAEVEEDVQNARVGSPYFASAQACKRIAQAEIARREAGGERLT